jgi:hypothetical protein
MEWKENRRFGRNVRATHHRARLRVRYARVTYIREIEESEQEPR